uniref:Sushi domain-containing protein n=1 Tax=Hippocampus comes TaxID=109280 RepID=A0A3Q2Z1D7_HIPCM
IAVFRLSRQISLEFSWVLPSMCVCVWCCFCAAAGHCGIPEGIVNGQVIGENFGYRDTVVYQCLPGFRLIGSSVRICLQDNQWSGQLPICIPISCDPGIPANSIRQSKIEHGNFTFGTVVFYDCNPGYDLFGSPVLSCQPTGQWDKPLPECIGEGRTKTAPISQGYRNSAIVILQDFTFGSTVRYSCLGGRQLKGESSRMCQLNGMWSTPMPFCSGNRRISASAPRCSSAARRATK